MEEDQEATAEKVRRSLRLPTLLHLEVDLVVATTEAEGTVVRPAGARER